jgi:hypothetical protein
MAYSILQIVRSRSIVIGPLGTKIGSPFVLSFSQRKRRAIPSMYLCYERQCQTRAFLKFDAPVRHSPDWACSKK